MPLLVSSSPLVRSGWPVPRPPALSPGAAAHPPALNSSPQCERHYERGVMSLLHPGLNIYAGNKSLSNADFYLEGWRRMLLSGDTVWGIPYKDRKYDLFNIFLIFRRQLDTVTFGLIGRSFRRTIPDKCSYTKDSRRIKNKPRSK